MILLYTTELAETLEIMVLRLMKSLKPHEWTTQSTIVQALMPEFSEETFNSSAI